MSHDDPKRSPGRPRRSTTRRGISPLADSAPGDDERTLIMKLEPAFSTRPTRREMTAVLQGDEPHRVAPPVAVPRGEYSVRGVGNIASDVVSGSIEAPPLPATGRTRRRSMAPVEEVHLASATKREITVIIKDQALTLDRRNALALAQIIVTAFD